MASLKKFLPWLPVMASTAAGHKSKPNIVVIMTDDQDAQLGSLDAMPYVRDTLMAEGVTLKNHFATVAQCCPSRTAWLRGQAAHNSNLTHVTAPGGGWEKFVQSGQEGNYLPHWLKAAGYQTEYIGKMMNGVNLATYNKPKPQGWDHTDFLLNPYTYEGNNVVMSMNGETPVFYNGFHQTDVIRAKAIDRLEKLTAGDAPFYIQIAPTAPHTSSDGPPVPCARHMWTHLSAKAPRTPNFNPEDQYQLQKPYWLKELPMLNESQIDFVDWFHQQRLQSLVGIDEMVEDIVEYLRSIDQLDNTYFIYTTDNGFHLGNHRQIGGKGLPYIEDTNIPMIIRGPGIKGGSSSDLPSSHVDMAPTFLEIAGLAKRSSSFLPFLDGRSLLEQWKSTKSHKKHIRGQEILNIEFWGTINNAGGPDFTKGSPVYAYKTIRIIDGKSSWLFSRWCDGNATELYNTNDDPYELNNLAIRPGHETQRLINRLNGLLLVTKSCNKESCRNPWNLLQKDAKAKFSSLDNAMNKKHDHFFSTLPNVGFQECMNYQSTANEGPYYPPESISLASEYRKPTDNYVLHNARVKRTPGNVGRMGTAAQRGVRLDVVMESARELTEEEIGTTVECLPPKYCGGGGD